MIDKEKYEELSTIVLKNVESQLSGDVPWDVRVKSLLDGLHGAAIKSQKLHEKENHQRNEGLMKSQRESKVTVKKRKYLKSRLPFHTENMESDSNKR